MCAGIIAERGRSDLPPLIGISRNLFNPVARVISRGPQAHPAGADGGEMCRHTLGDGVGIHRPQLTADGGSERGPRTLGACAHDRATSLERLAERFSKHEESAIPGRL
jgi:hypothetical protein